MVLSFVQVPRKITYEVNADGRDVALGVGVIGESQQQTRLSDTRVTDQEELEEVVVSKARRERIISRGLKDTSASRSAASVAV